MVDDWDHLDDLLKRASAVHRYHLYYTTLAPVRLGLLHGRLH